VISERRDVMNQPSGGERRSPKTELGMANKHAARPAFSSERLEVLATLLRFSCCTLGEQNLPG